MIQRPRTVLHFNQLSEFGWNSLELSHFDLKQHSDYRIHSHQSFGLNVCYVSFLPRWTNTSARRSVRSSDCYILVGRLQRDAPPPTLGLHHQMSTGGLGLFYEGTIINSAACEGIGLTRGDGSSTSGPPEIVCIIVDTISLPNLWSPSMDRLGRYKSVEFPNQRLMTRREWV